MPHGNISWSALRPPFTDFELAQLQGLLNGLWTLPSDLRLNLGFQKHMLRRLDRSLNAVEQAAIIREEFLTLSRIGGSFEVIDCGQDDSSFSYSLSTAASAADAEEWLLKIPPTAWRMTPNGFPTWLANPRHAPWRRLM